MGIVSECDLAEPESLASLGGSAPGVVDEILSAVDKLLSDSAKTEISNKVMDILRAYHISNWHSEPYHQNQNPPE